MTTVTNATGRKTHGPRRAGPAPDGAGPAPDGASAMPAGTMLESTGAVPDGAEPEMAEHATQVPGIVEVACRFAVARQRPVVFFLLAEGDPAEGRDVPITRRTLDQLANALDDDRFPELDLVVSSSGGDINAAYQMMLLLQGRVDKDTTSRLVTHVPRRAQSAATLLCLGADELRLGETAALGPLDAQIKKGVTEIGTPDYVSALHLLKGLARLRKFSLETFDDIAARLYDRKVRRNEDILRYSIDFTSAITAPLFERIQSQDVGTWDQLLQTAEAYGNRLLASRNLFIRSNGDVGRKELDQQRRQVVHNIVFEYTTHDRVLDLAELVDELHLNAKPIDDPALAAAVRDFAGCTAETFIAIIYPPTAAGHVPIKDARPLSRAEWRSLKTTTEAARIRWTNGEGAFTMRVGLYRESATSRNPWRGKANRRPLGLAAQYMVDPGQGFDPGEMDDDEYPYDYTDDLS